MMRSGTTLIEQILASHKKVSGAGELAAFRLAAEAVMGADAYPEAVASLSAGQLWQIGARYLGHLRAEFPRAERVVDKMPANFLFAGLIAQVLPNARIIHARRDPADTCLSCFSICSRVICRSPTTSVNWAATTGPARCSWHIGARCCRPG